MIRIANMEKLGVSVAAMSEVSDGDASGPALASICRALGLDESKLITIRQVHGRDVVLADDLTPGPNAIEADAILVTRPGIPVAIRVADCVPVWLYARDFGVGAVVHAGREGTLRRISEAVVRILKRKFGVPAASLRAVLGPSAGPCCYEVSQEIADLWRIEGLVTDGRRLDLWRSNALQLEFTGIPHGNVELPTTCTVCTTAFHSYRRVGSSERNAAILSI